MAKALILSGGGAKGAFSVGALTVLQQRPQGWDFNFVSGTSTGSLIAVMVAAGRLDILRRIYTTVNNNDIVRKSNIISNIRNDKPFILSDAPLRNIVSTELNENVFQQIMSSSMTLLLTAVSLQTGKITVFTTKPVAPPPLSKYRFKLIGSRNELLNALSASSNQFAFLPPVPMVVNGNITEQFIDGGCRDTVPTNVIFELVPDPEEVIVLSNNPMELVPITTQMNGVLDILFRGISIFIQDVRENDLQALNQWQVQTGKQATWIKPDQDLDPDYSTGLRFEPQRMSIMMLLGEQKARAVLNMPAGGAPMKVAAKKSIAKKSVAKKSVAKKSAAKKSAAKKSVAKKSATKKSANKKVARKRNALKGKSKKRNSRVVKSARIITPLHRCSAITEAGKQCRNKVKGRNKFCHVHDRA